MDLGFISRNFKHLIFSSLKYPIFAFTIGNLSLSFASSLAITAANTESGFQKVLKVFLVTFIMT